MKSSARHTVWSPPKDSTSEVRGEGPLAGPPFQLKTHSETPPIQLPSLLLAHGKLVSGPQRVPCAEGHSRGYGSRKRTIRRLATRPLGLHDLEALSAAGRASMIAASAPFASCGLTWTPISDAGVAPRERLANVMPLQRDARVVVVDDDTFFVEAMLVLLPQLGLAPVACAMDGAEAVAVVREHYPDVFLVDK